MELIVSHHVGGVSVAQPPINKRSTHRNSKMVAPQLQRSGHVHEPTFFCGWSHTYLGHPHLRQSFDMSTFFEVHAESNCQQLLCTHIMERTIFECKEGEDDAQEGEQERKHLTPALQVPIPDIKKEEMNKLIKRCRISWIHHNPVVLDSVLIPQFLHWNERCHAKENVDLKHFEKRH